MGKFLDCGETLFLLPLCLSCRHYIFSPTVGIICSNVFLVSELVFSVAASHLPRPYPVFFTDVVQLKAPGMRPNSAEHLEILEEFGPCAAPAPLRRTPHTCRQGKGWKKMDVCLHYMLENMPSIFS